MIAKEAESRQNQRQYLVFHVAGQACAVPLADVKEIVLMAELSTVLGAAPDYLAGLLNLSGEAIPVFKLHRFLALPEWEIGLYSHIILTKIHGKTYGFLSQAVQKILSVSPDQFMPSPGPSSLNGFGLTMLLDGKDFISTLAFATLIAAYEKDRLAPEPQNFGLNLAKEAS